MSIKIAMIGAGNVVGLKHSEAYEKLAGRVEVFAIADPSAAARDKLGEKFGVPPARRVARLEELAAFRDEVRLAVVATPLQFHSEGVLFAASMGWDVLCEKPPAIRIEELDSMLDATESAGVRFGVMHNYHFMHIAGDCQSAVHRGEIGDVRMVRCEFQGGSYVRGSSYIHYADKERDGAGHFLGCLYHEIYLMLDAVGAPAERIYADVGNLVPQQINVEDTLACQIRFANGALGLFQDVMINDGEGTTLFEYYGTRGSLLRNPPFHPPTWLYRDGKREELPPDSAITDHGTYGVMRDFVSAIETGKPLPSRISAEHAGRETLRVVLAAYESGRTSNPVDLRTWNIRKR